MRTSPHRAVFKQGVLRCGTCDHVLRPGHAKKNCCKAAFKRHWQDQMEQILGKIGAKQKEKPSRK